MIIDTHGHLVDEAFDGEVPDLLARAREAGVGKIVNPGYDRESSDKSVAMAAEWEELYATLGVNPYDAEEADEELMEKWLKSAAENEKIVAIGECGLDFFKASVEKEIQEKAFMMQIILAQKAGLPLIIHNRSADEECLRILDKMNALGREDRVKVVFHSFGSDVGFAKEVWMRGYYTSISGIVTFPSADNVRDVIKQMPLDKFFVETDSPYLAPQAYRGDRNEPSYVVEVAKKIAEIREIDLIELEQMVTDNTLRFFDRI